MGGWTIVACVFKSYQSGDGRRDCTFSRGVELVVLLERTGPIPGE